jgi:hypothetical protein
VTGRSLHDALLRVLTSGSLRARLLAGQAGATLGPDEAAALRQADPDRLRRLARFFGRHFYRERIVRLFAAGRRLAGEGGEDLLGLLATPAFDALLETAEVGSAATADRVATLVEARLGLKGGGPTARTSWPTRAPSSGSRPAHGAGGTPTRRARCPCAPPRPGSSRWPGTSRL